jgi:hypothetical protein
MLYVQLLFQETGSILMPLSLVNNISLQEIIIILILLYLTRITGEIVTRWFGENNGGLTYQEQEIQYS